MRNLENTDKLGSRECKSFSSLKINIGQEKSILGMWILLGSLRLSLQSHTGKIDKILQITQNLPPIFECRLFTNPLGER